MGFERQPKWAASSRKMGSVSVGRRKARKFSADFKLEAVKRVLYCEESITGVAKDLGIARSTLGRWKRELTPVIQNETAAADQWVPIEIEAIEPAAEATPASRADVAAFSPEPWEQTSLRAALRGESETSDWSSLLADSVAFQRQRIGEIEQLHDDGSGLGSDTSALIDDLVCQAAVSLSLINDTQAAIDRMIHASRMAEAKQLSGFRTELRRDLSEIIDRIGADAFRQAQGKARAMGALWRRVEPVLRTVDVRDDEAPLPQPIVHRSRSPRIRRHRRRTRPTEARDRTKGLLLGLVAAGLLWLALGIPRYEQKPVAVIELADFEHVGGIHALTATPPSLSVVLDADLWHDLPNGERRRLIGELGRTARIAGYQSADCATTSGENVAKWHRTSGVRLHDDPNATDMVAQAPPATLEERLSGRIAGRRLWKTQPSERSPAE